MINKKFSLISLFFLSQVLLAGSFRANSKNGSSFLKKPFSSYANKVSIKEDNQVNSSSFAADDSLIIDRRTINGLIRDLEVLKRDIKKLNNAVVASQYKSRTNTVRGYISRLFSRFFSRSEKSEKN